jgi:hypothetical protein
MLDLAVQQLWQSIVFITDKKIGKIDRKVWYKLAKIKYLHTYLYMGRGAFGC